MLYKSSPSRFCDDCARRGRGRPSSEWNQTITSRVLLRFWRRLVISDLPLRSSFSRRWNRSGVTSIRSGGPITWVSRSRRWSEVAEKGSAVSRRSPWKNDVPRTWVRLLKRLTRALSCSVLAEYVCAVDVRGCWFKRSNETYLTELRLAGF